MAVLTIRDVPEDLLRLLKQLAVRHRRSLQQEALAQLEQARIRATDSPVERARALRDSLAGQPLGDVVEDVRRERER